MIGAAEMAAEGLHRGLRPRRRVPLPPVEGLSAMARAYEEVGMRAVLAADGGRPLPFSRRSPA